MAAKTDWHSMWKELGLDLEKHDQLLNVLPTVYKEIYIDAQKNRPQNMGFWEFVVGDIHGIRVSELVKAKKEGKKVIGTFCLYVPDEIIASLGGISVGLCGGTNFSNYAADGKVPSNTCPLIKSALGFGLGKICPYYESTDLLIGETTCDGKKKAWEILGNSKEMYVMETPQKKKTPQARALFIAELKSLVARIGDLTKKKLDYNTLKANMEKFQKKRDLLARIYTTRQVDPVPISGKDALLVSQVAFYDDVDREIEMLGKLATELEQRVKDKVGVIAKGAKRIMISGTPMAIPNWKMHHIIESSGAAVVCEETCTGTRYFENKLKITGKDVNGLLEDIADRYLGINCACFTPNKARLDDIKRLAKEYKVNGVVLYSLSFCQTYEMEAVQFEKELKNADIPVLNISTDYSSEDAGQLQTRIQAFLELLK